MPSFDVSSDVDWQEIDNAIHQADKEVGNRFDFKGVKVEIKMDKKAQTVTIWCSSEPKLDSVKDVFENKLVKRGVSLLAFDFQKEVDATQGSIRQLAKVQAGISKEKGKEIIALLKSAKLKVQAQIQDETVRVTGKKRDDLQTAIAHLKENQDKLKVPMQFGNFRE